MMEMAATTIGTTQNDSWQEVVSHLEDELAFKGGGDVMGRDQGINPA
jgi:hypothetical protein